MTWPAISVRTKVTVFLLVVIGAGFYYFTAWLVGDLRRFHLQSMEESLVDTSHVLAAAVATDLAQGDPTRLTNAVATLAGAFERAAAAEFDARIYQLHKTQVDLQVYVADTNGVIVYDSEGERVGADFNQWNDVARTLQGRYGARSTRLDPDDPTSSILHIGAPIMVDGELRGVLTVRKPVAYASEFVRDARRQIVVAAWLAGLTVALGGAVLTILVTQPIRRLTRYVRAIRDGERAELPRLGHNEIGEMGRALEEMRDALEGKEYVEEYVHTLTHEFKSPIAAIQGAAELLREDMPAGRRERFLGTIEAETDRMRHYVDRLLDLAGLEKRQGLGESNPVPLRPLVENLADILRTDLDPRGLRVEIHGEDVAALGEAQLLRQALDNVLRNAVAFSPDGGVIEVRVGREGTVAEIEVRDHGPGVPDYALSKVTDRFYSLPRPDSGMKSSGLGLALVQEVATLHGGEFRVDNHPGGGARARLRLPLAPPPS